VYRLVLSGDQVDLWVVHRGGFIIDLLAGFALSCQSTRLVGAIITTMFHVMNSFIFAIGQSVAFFPIGVARTFSGGALLFFSKS